MWNGLVRLCAGFVGASLMFALFAYGVHSAEVTPEQPAVPAAPAAAPPAGKPPAKSPAPPPPNPPPPETKAAPPALTIRCVFVRDHEFLDGLGLDADRGTQQANAPKKSDASAANPGFGADRTQEPTACPQDASDETVMTYGTLTGAGDVEVVVTQASYKLALGYEVNTGMPMVLYLNGVALGSDAELIAIENRNRDVHLRYRVKPEKNSQKLWAMLYRSGALTELHPLRVALGWTGAPTSAPQATDRRAKIAVTNTLKEIIVAVVLILLGALTLVIAKKTDALRDAPLPKEQKDQRKPVRAAFSLARVQLAVWFVFAVAAGVFMWIVYGQLPPIDASLLALLGLSVGTAGVSLAVDKNSGGRTYSPSQGFLTDLVTGFDDKQQVHRYQAVVVNLLLLFVGISHVLQQLTYPIFDATWLALLGVSGIALGVGKQLLEDPKTQPGQAPAPAPAQGGATPASGEAGAVG